MEEITSGKVLREGFCRRSPRPAIQRPGDAGTEWFPEQQLGQSLLPSRGGQQTAPEPLSPQTGLPPPPPLSPLQFPAHLGWIHASHLPAEAQKQTQPLQTDEQGIQCKNRHPPCAHDQACGEKQPHQRAITSETETLTPREAALT